MDKSAFTCNTPSALKGDKAEVLAKIYDKSINLTVWQRALSSDVEAYAHYLTKPEALFSKFQGIISLDNAKTALEANLPTTSLEQSEQSSREAFINDVARIIEMFGCLFDLNAVGLRLAVINNAMCPKFHTDRVPCRLVTSFKGEGTEWLENFHANRNKLGRNSIGKDDKTAGIYQHERLVQKIPTGHIALLKGEAWEGNEDNGLVHRSPMPQENQTRLVMTLDFAS